MWRLIRVAFRARSHSLKRSRDQGLGGRRLRSRDVTQETGHGSRRGTGWKSSVLEESVFWTPTLRQPITSWEFGEWRLPMHRILQSLEYFNLKIGLFHLISENWQNFTPTKQCRPMGYDFIIVYRAISNLLPPPPDFRILSFCAPLLSVLIDRASPIFHHPPTLLPIT